MAAVEEPVCGGRLRQRKQAIDLHNAELEKQLKPLRDQLAAIRGPYEQVLLEKKLLTLPEALRSDVRSALNTPAGKRSEIEKYLVAKLGDTLKVTADEVQAAIAGDDRARSAPLEEAFGRWRRAARSMVRFRQFMMLVPPRLFISCGGEISRLRWLRCSLVF